MATMIDPPEGWRYGFPKECSLEFKSNDEFNDWLVENGYPRSLIESYGKHFHFRMWSTDNE